MENIISKFVQNRKNQTVGVVIACRFPDSNNVYVTGSLCKNTDVFEKKIAITLAEDRARAMAFENRACPVAFSLKTDIEYMIDRAKRYFKNMSVVASPIKSNF